MIQPVIGTTLWCLPYDTDSVFKPFLKIPFSSYLNHLISNEHFPAYQANVAKQLDDRSCWNQKSWLLVSYFEFLNESFDISVWDSHINFIEDNHLRNIMGFFRLWIDTQRLYLLGFLKLDSNQFQQDRIYMCFFRTLLFFNTLFNQYVTSDFDPEFLSKFISVSKTQLQKIKLMSTNQTASLVQAIIQLLINLKKKERVLIQLSTLQNLKKSAVIKVTRERQTLGEVQMRLKNSALFKRSLDQEKRLHRISKEKFIEEMSQPVRPLHDNLYRIDKQVQSEFYGDQEDRKKMRTEEKAARIKKYKRDVVEAPPREDNIYMTLDKSGTNPYSSNNYQLYGEMIHINMEERQKYEKEKIAEVTSVDQNQKLKTFYDDDFMKQVEEAHFCLGRVTANDINTTAKTKAKKVDSFKQEDENTRVFNLKWHHNPNSSRKRSSQQINEVKDYDNNLLFKSPLEEKFLTNRKNNLDKLKEAHEVNSYTVALIEQMGNQLFPEGDQYSHGSTPFVNRIPQVLDVKNFKLINHNKFDFMRKVVGYMSAQKKIQRVLGMKPVPQLYPRTFRDMKQQSFDPDLINEKVKYAMGRTEKEPSIYI